MKGKTVQNLIRLAYNHPHYVVYFGGSQRRYDAALKLVNRNLAKFIGDGCIQMILTRGELERAGI